MAEVALTFRVVGTQQVQQALQSVSQSAQQVQVRTAAVTRTVDTQAVSVRGVRQSFIQLSAAIAGVSAVSSLLARNNPELARSFELVSLAGSGLSVVLRAVGNVMRLVIGIVGAKIAIIALAVTGIVLMVRHWDQAKEFIGRAVKAIGDVVARVFAGIRDVFAGFISIIRALITRDWDAVRAGVDQMKEGFAAIGAVVVDVGRSAIDLGRRGLEFLKTQFGKTDQAAEDLQNTLDPGFLATMKDVAANLQGVAFDARDGARAFREQQAAAGELAEALTPVIQQAHETAAALQGVALEARDGAKATTQMATDAELNFGTLLTVANNALANIRGRISTTFAGIIQGTATFGDLWTAIWQAAVAKIIVQIHLVELAVSAISGILAFFGILLQRGGSIIATRPTPIMVGEAGAERVTVEPLAGAPSRGGGENTIVLQGPMFWDEISYARFIRRVGRDLAVPVGRVG